jgi:hypothetical protein
MTTQINTEALCSWIDERMVLFSESNGTLWADTQIWISLENRPKLKHRQTLIQRTEVKDWIQGFLCWNQHSDWEIDQDGIDFTASCFRQSLNWGTVLKFINESIWDCSSVGSEEAAEEWGDLRKQMLASDWCFWGPRYRMTPEVAAALSEDPQPVC